MILDLHCLSVVVLKMGTLVTCRHGMNDSSVDSDCLIAHRLGVDDSCEEGGAERLGCSHAGIVRPEPGLQPAQSAGRTYDGSATATFKHVYQQLSKIFVPFACQLHKRGSLDHRVTCMTTCEARKAVGCIQNLKCRKQM